MFVSSKEAGCVNKKSNAPNKNGTWDYCFMQINNEPSAMDLDTCARRAWEKFSKDRHDWGQWYAVCKPGRIPKYQLNCNR